MESKLVLYNTLTRRKEVFEPLTPGRVGMYVCGPTVYGDPHLGHARPAVTFDLMFRYLKSCGYKVRYVRNITDVGHLEHDADEGEDKIAKKARLEQLEPMEVAHYYTERYHRAMDALNVETPSIEPYASGHIIEQIEFVKKILADGNLVNLVMRPETPEVPDTKAEQPAETASDEPFDIEECRKAAGEGDVAACRTLGEYYENPKDESIQPRNLYAAQNWYRKAADSGDSEAEYLLACSYLNLCEDLEEPRPDDLRNALHWFRRAAGQGHAGAQERLTAWSGEVAAVTAQPDAPLSCGRGKDRSVIDDYAKLLNTFDAAMSHGTRLVTSPKDKGVIVGRTRYEELRKELLTGDRYGAATYRAALDSLQAHHTIRSFQDMARDYMFTMLQKFYDERPIEWSQPRKTGKGCYEMTDMKTLFIYVIEDCEEGIRICRKESGEE